MHMYICTNMYLHVAYCLAQGLGGGAPALCWATVAAVGSRGYGVGGDVLGRDHIETLDKAPTRPAFICIYNTHIYIYIYIALVLTRLSSAKKCQASIGLL